MISEYKVWRRKGLYKLLYMLILWPLWFIVAGVNESHEKWNFIFLFQKCISASSAFAQPYLQILFILSFENKSLLRVGGLFVEIINTYYCFFCSCYKVKWFILLSGLHNDFCYKMKILREYTVLRRNETYRRPWIIN